MSLGRTILEDGSPPPWIYYVMHKQHFFVVQVLKEKDLDYWVKQGAAIYSGPYPTASEAIDNTPEGEVR